VVHRKITLLQIEYFLAVAKYLSFTEAARNLYISQPSLSKQIAMLEEEMGVKLFYRTRRDVRLTPSGAVLYSELEGLTDSIEKAIDKAKQPDIGQKLSLSISCLEAMDTDLFIPPLIRLFKEKHPGVALSLERHSFKALREKLISGSLEIVFTISFEVSDMPGIVQDEVYRENSGIFMSRANPLAAKEKITLEDVRGEDFVMISREESPNGFDGIIALCRKHGFKPNIVKQLPNIESLLLCVELGLGITIFDSNIRMGGKNDLKFFRLEEDFLCVVMAWKKDNMNPAVSMFVNSALSSMAEQNKND
jgi:DNA-binding transcriptional LysR family regulator